MSILSTVVIPWYRHRMETWEMRSEFNLKAVLVLGLEFVVLFLIKSCRIELSYLQIELFDRHIH